ncbi:adenylyl-sulfate kinase [Undibacterium sp. Dicai25W]|uniref:adenylyl-sulfate kinase n=1 Tax=Undibacterium sp. Dicai25W TaxID=3413034 RepID=UPI003BF0F0A9
MQTSLNLVNTFADTKTAEVKRETFGRFVTNANAHTENITWHYASVTSAVKQHSLQQVSVTLWLTGLSASGKSSIACALDDLLIRRGYHSAVLDGDNLRHHLNSDLGFSATDRRENIRRTAEVAHLFNEAGMIAITALISPHKADREMARAIIGEQRFLEVYVSASVSKCEERDPKGLYVKARQGRIPEFTGISAPYEAPQAPALEINTENTTIEAAAEQLFNFLVGQAYLK